MRILMRGMICIFFFLTIVAIHVISASPSFVSNDFQRDTVKINDQSDSVIQFLFNKYSKANDAFTQMPNQQHLNDHTLDYLDKLKKINPRFWEQQWQSDSTSFQLRWSREQGLQGFYPSHSHLVTLMQLNKILREILALLENNRNLVSDWLESKRSDQLFNNKEEKDLDYWVSASACFQYVYEWLDMEAALELAELADQEIQSRIALQNHLMSGKFHRSHLRNVVAFQGNQLVGQEKESERINQFTLGEPVFMRAYFRNDLKSSGGLPSLVLRIRPNGSQGPFKICYQPMYFPEPELDMVLGQAFLDFGLFPELKQIKFGSHLQYIPLINVLTYFSRLQPGSYELEIAYGQKKELASGTFLIHVTAESLKETKDYLKELYEQKTDYVTFPMVSCQNKAGSVPNIELLKTYGELLKIDFSPSDDVRYPWPDSDEVQWHRAKGYAAIKRGETVELIPVLLRKSHDETNYSFYSLGEKSENLKMNCSDGTSISADSLHFGYEIRKQNIHNCQAW